MDASQASASSRQAPEEASQVAPQPAAPVEPPPAQQQEEDSDGGEGADGGSGDGEDEDEDDKLFANAQKLMDKITSSPENPNPNVLHALASMLEAQESRYMEETGHFTLTNGRASHSIGKLGNILRDNDEFFELISSRFLCETRYSLSVQAAAARLLLSCSLTWVYPHVFEDAVLERLKTWVMDETLYPGDRSSLKHEAELEKPSDAEILSTFSTGLLAVCLSGGGPVVEDALTSGLAAKLMRYLRSWVLGETSIAQKDSGYPADSKNTSNISSLRSKEEGRARVRSVLETAHLDEQKIIGEQSAGDQSLERNLEKSNGRLPFGQDCWVDAGEQFDCLDTGSDAYDIDAVGEDRWHVQDLRDGKMKVGDSDENARDDLRRKVSRGWVRSRGKGRVNEGVVDCEQGLNVPGSGSRMCYGRVSRERSASRNSDVRKTSDAIKFLGSSEPDGSATIREDYDDRFQEFKVGSKDISDIIKQAVRAAEAEARAANGPDEAIKAAGDAAAEVVKSAAIEEFQTANDEEAAFLAASRAASTVIDAATAVELSRSCSSIIPDSVNSNASEREGNEEAEEFFLPSSQALAQLREKYYILCLVALGEYVEVLGPVLHEKGVDVCIALLQRSSKHQEAAKVAMLLPDVLKLICTLAAHRKFAALFVDRGGMQKLLAIPRVPQTFFGLSSCLVTISSLQAIMERVCTLPSDIIQQVVELALQLLTCPQDQARKNAALFIAAASVFRAVIESFDAQDGLQKVLSLLHDAASVRSGVTSGTVGLSTAGSLRNDRSPSEVLTSSEKQIAYHTCVALRQYFRAHLLLLVDSIRPTKNSRSAYRNIPIAKAAYKPLDISNEAIDAVLLQLQKDRKLGPAFVRARWPVVDKFLVSNGHITMLELCQAPPVERFLHDLLQYALGVLHIVTLVPHSRKLIVNATLSNDRVGIAVILDAANCASYVDHEIIQPALNVLINLVCPPPSISNKPPQSQQSLPVQTSSIPSMDNRERTTDGNLPDRAASISSQSEPRERNAESSLADRGNTQQPSVGSQTPVPTVTSGLVGDRRIYLGVGAGSAGLAAQLEQGYRQAREAVRAHNGIKVLLHLLQPRIVSPPATLDCLRALACRVLLGLARDETIAHILTKLQVGKRLSELIRDSGNQTPGTEQGRWQAELAQVAIELIAIVTNSGRASTLAATDAATPTLRRIERAAIAAATPITYHSRELLLLIHEHLQASGLATAATALLKEAQLTPLPTLAAPSSLAHQISTQENVPLQIQWPSGRTPCGFLTNKTRAFMRDEDPSLMRCDSAVSSSKKRPLAFSSSLSFQSRNQSQTHDCHSSSTSKVVSSSNKFSASAGLLENPAISPLSKPTVEMDSQCKTPIILPMKRKQMESRDAGLSLSVKRLNTGELGFRSPNCSVLPAGRKSGLPADAIGFSTPSSVPREHLGRSVPGSGLIDNLDDTGGTPACQMIPVHPGLLNDQHPSNSERLTLDSLVVQYLKHQHRQCSAPITTLPPLSLLHPHVCPEPRRSLDAPSNVTARLSTREFRSMHGGIHGHRKDRQFVYSRYRPWRSCREEGALLTCLTFLDNSSHIAVGSHSGELKVFDSDTNDILESCTSHQAPLTCVQSHLFGETQLVLSSSPHDVLLWDASSISAGPMHAFQGCKSARFSNLENIFAALPSEQPRREILLYDVQTFQLESTLSDSSSSSSGLGRGHAYSLVHFSPSDTMLLWNGVLWDRRSSGPVHRFDQFTDYGGGGFHPAGNEVIINSEVWDLRKFRLLRSVPSLDQTVITFNARGDIIYAILRRNLEDITSAVHTRRVKHSLFSAFRAVDAVNYSDIATTLVDRCVLDFATEPTDSFVGLVTMDDQEEMFSSARVYEIGRRKPTDDDSDPDDAESEEEEEDEDDSDGDQMLGPDFDADAESELDDMSNDEDSISDLDDDDDEDDDMEGGTGILQILAETDEDDDSQLVESLSSGDEEDFAGNGFTF